MLERIRDAVAAAAGEGITVAFFGVDGTRADLDFFRAAYEAAVEAGAREAVVVDTLGIARPRRSPSSWPDPRLARTGRADSLTATTTSARAPRTPSPRRAPARAGFTGR